MRLLSLAFSFGWTEVAKPPSRRQGRAFLHLARFLLLYLFLLLPAPRSPVDNLLPLLLLFSSLPDSSAAQCSLPNIPSPSPLSPLSFSRVLSFSSFLSFHFSTCCFLICLTSHASRPPFSLFLSACILVPRTIETVHRPWKTVRIFVTVLVSFLLRRLLFTRFCERDEENKLLPARENASKIYTYFT